MVSHGIMNLTILSSFTINIYVSNKKFQLYENCCFIKGIDVRIREYEVILDTVTLRIMKIILIKRLIDYYYFFLVKDNKLNISFLLRRFTHIPSNRFCIIKNRHICLSLSCGKHLMLRIHLDK